MQTRQKNIAKNEMLLSANKKDFFAVSAAYKLKSESNLSGLINGPDLKSRTEV